MSKYIALCTMALASCQCIELPPKTRWAGRETGQRSCTGQLESGWMTPRSLQRPSAECQGTVGS